MTGVPVLDGPMMVNAGPGSQWGTFGSGSIRARAGNIAGALLNQGAAAAAQVPNASEQQKIVTIASLRGRRSALAGQPRCWLLWSCTASPTGATRFFIAGTSTGAACFASPA